MHRITHCAPWLLLFPKSCTSSPLQWGTFLHMQLLFPPISNTKKPLSDLSTVCFSLPPHVLIWPFWKDISTDVHSLNNKADHPPPLPHLTIISQPWLESFILSLCAWCEKHNALGKKTRVLHLPELLGFCCRLCGNCLWLSYLMASCAWRCNSSSLFNLQTPTCAC